MSQFLSLKNGVVFKMLLSKEKNNGNNFYTSYALKEISDNPELCKLAQLFE
jgi:hypothetical protein